MYHKPSLFLLRTITSGLGAGYSPISPGTLGSCTGLLVWWLAHQVPLEVSPLLFQLSLICTVTIVGYGATKAFLSTHPQYSTNTISKVDPQCIVIDEWAGLWIALFAAAPSSPFSLLLGFALFRFFDITKWWIIRRAEKAPGAVGIMLDDIVAGVFALIARILIEQFLTYR